MSRQSKRHQAVPLPYVEQETRRVVTPDVTRVSQKRKEPAMQINRLHKKLGSSPLILFFLGLLALLLWTCATIVQIQTSELLALGSAARVAGVDFNVLPQPWLLITGRAPISVVTAWCYAWIVELITLVFATALSAAVVKISSVNPHLAKFFIVGGTVLILLNGWADYSSSPGSNPVVQFLIALAIGGIVVVGLPLGIGLLEHGFEQF